VDTPYLQQFETISSPVPNLAATLFNLPIEANDVNDENVNFLRTPTRSPSESSSSRARRRRIALLPEVDLESMDIDEQRRFVPSPAEITPRLPSARRQPEGLNAVPSYEGRMSNRRSLYGWAPGSEDEQGDYYHQYQPHTSSQNYQPDNTLIVAGGPDREPSRNASLSRSSRRDAIGSTLLPYAGDLSETTDSSNPHWSGHNGTFTDALLQSVRRGARFASRTRTLQNYILDRERIGRQETDERERELDRERERTRTTSSSAARALRMSLRNVSGDLRDRVNTHRQFLTENPPSPRLRGTIKYLEGIRHSSSFSESIASAVRSGVVPYDQLLGSYSEVDFILDTRLITPPSSSSWLHPGSVFSGSQKAVNSIGGHSFDMISHRLSQPQNILQTTRSPAANDSDRLNDLTSSGRRYWANNNLSPAHHQNQHHRHHTPRESKHELWPVKVTIHSIDYTDMTLTGTMEAYNIPDKTSPTRDAHIVTFLEGEIIDLIVHTLETTNFPANADIDCTYWRELRPFRGLTDEQMTKNLLSKKWVTEELNRNWILMRWKGKPTPISNNTRFL
jgi:Vacuolar import and degradation protein